MLVSDAPFARVTVSPLAKSYPATGAATGTSYLGLWGRSGPSPAIAGVWNDAAMRAPVSAAVAQANTCFGEIILLSFL
ncbi:hypothetical protein ACGFI3_25180 [Nonomuraea wenchangensis]|uniref:hypothetical protein n=1 Tax=Nonomuraea wenchangensis TaxID=568860 RepID=UPI0015A65B18